MICTNAMSHEIIIFLYIMLHNHNTLKYAMRIWGLNCWRHVGRIYMSVERRGRKRERGSTSESCEVSEMLRLLPEWPVWCAA